MKYALPIVFFFLLFIINKNNPYLFSKESAKESFFIDEVHYGQSPHEHGAYEDSFDNLSSFKIPTTIKEQHYKANIGLFNQPISPPLLLDDSVILATDYGLIERRDFNGELIWSYRIIGARSGIVTNIIKFKNTIYFGGMNGWLYSLNINNGHPRWSFYLGDYVGCNLATDGKSIFTCASTNRYTYRLRIASLDIQTGKLNWDTYKNDITGFYDVSLNHGHVFYKSYSTIELVYNLNGDEIRNYKPITTKPINLETDSYGQKWVVNGQHFYKRNNIVLTSSDAGKTFKLQRF